MLAEHVYQRLRSQIYLPVTLEDVNDTPRLCLEALDHLLQEVAKLRHEAVDHAAASKEKLDHLTGSIKRLTDHNALLHTRLLACLDTLDAVKVDKPEDVSTSGVKAELDAMKLLNQNLVARLHEANRQNADLRETLAHGLGASNIVNGPATIKRAVVATAELESNEDDLSDAGTEVQYDAHAASDRARQGHVSPQHASRPASLRTRTVLYEMVNELMSARQELTLTQADHQRQISLMQSHIDSRNKELTNIYNQLELFCGLPGVALAKTWDQESSATSENVLSTTMEELEIVTSLRAQLQHLQSDVMRLTAEKDNIARYASSVPPRLVPYASEGSRDAFKEEDHVATSEDPPRRRAEYEAVARRASQRLLEQSYTIESLQRELHRAKMLAGERSSFDIDGSTPERQPHSSGYLPESHFSGASISRPHSVPLVNTRIGDTSTVKPPSLGAPWHASL